MQPDAVSELNQFAIPSAEVPQANHLAKIRQLVELCQNNKSSPAALRRSLGLDTRHLAYYRKAAALLKLVASQPDRTILVTDRGRGLLATISRSEAERAALLGAIRDAQSLRHFLSFLEGTETLGTAALAARISELSGLGPSTASRRAQCIEQWRAYLSGTEAVPEVHADLEELPTRIREVLERSNRILQHALEHYNAFSCPVRNVVVVQHADHSLELLVKAKLAVSGRPEALESDDFDLFRCINILADLPQYRGVLKRPPLLSLLHRQRNAVQHAGESVTDDLLTLLMAQSVKTYVEWSRILFGRDLNDLFPVRHSLAIPNFDIDVQSMQERQIQRLREAGNRKTRLPRDEIRSALYLRAALSPQLSDEEKEAVFASGTPLTPEGQELSERLRKVDARRTVEYVELAEFLATSPTIRVMSKTSGAKSGAVPIYLAPKDPNAVPINTTASASLKSSIIPIACEIG